MANHYPQLWEDREKRDDIINGVIDRFNLSSNTIKVKQLTSADEEQLFELSCLATEHTPFFATSIGLTVDKMPMYWKSINRVLFTDPHSVILGAFSHNRLVAVLSFATKSFPNSRHVMSLFWRFVTTMGIKSTASFLSAINNYEKMFPGSEELDYATVVRGVWLYSHPDTRNNGAGRVLVKAGIQAVKALGFRYAQLACDGTSERLIRYYKILGGSVAWRKNHQGICLAMVAWQL